MGHCPTTSVCSYYVKYQFPSSVFEAHTLHFRVLSDCCAFLFNLTSRISPGERLAQALQGLTVNISSFVGSLCLGTPVLCHYCRKPLSNNIRVGVACASTSFIQAGSQLELANLGFLGHNCSFQLFSR